GPHRPGRDAAAGQLGLRHLQAGRPGLRGRRRPGLPELPREGRRHRRSGQRGRQPGQLLVRLRLRRRGRPGAGHPVPQRVQPQPGHGRRLPGHGRDPGGLRPRGLLRGPGGRGLPLLRLRHGAQRPALPAVLGPGPGPGTGAGAAEQPLADLPGRDPARRVRREHERDPLGMTAGQPRVPAAASTQAADPSREVDASRGGSGDPAGHGTVGPSERGKKRLKTGPSNWLLLPALSFFGIFALLPLAGVVLLSFFAWDGLGTPSFAGLTAWFTVFQDPVTLNAMWLTLLMTVLSYVVQFPLSLLLGTFMAGHQRYREVFSVLYFLPLLFSAAAVGIAFKALLDPNFGLSRAFGLDLLRQDWLGSPNFAFYTLIMVISWSFVPFHSLLYQAGVRQIPASMYEAATLDGAGRVRQFFNV